MINMNKPITLVIEETKTKLADIINTSGLPPFVIEPILSTFLQEAHAASKRQYEIDKLQYEQAIAKEQEDLDKDVKKDESES
jgi:hypothetical protein